MIVRLVYLLMVGLIGWLALLARVRSRTRQVRNRFNRYQERIRETPAHRHAEFDSGLIQD